jgi:hypothetical protein
MPRGRSGVQVALDVPGPSISPASRSRRAAGISAPSWKTWSGRGRSGRHQLSWASSPRKRDRCIDINWHRQGRARESDVEEGRLG